MYIHNVGVVLKNKKEELDETLEKKIARNKILNSFAFKTLIVPSL